MKNRAVSALCAIATVFLSPTANARNAHADLVAAAQKEGKVVVYSVLSTGAAQPLIKDFEALYPGIKVDYDGDKGSNEMDARYRRETAAGEGTADVVWSSSTDMQMKLVADGFAAKYRSPEARHLPSWAVYRNRAYGTTLEPVVFAYNPTLLAPDKAPKSHTELAAMLRADPERFRGRVTGFDIEKSGVGLMFAMQDRERFAGLDSLLDAFGQVCFAPSGGTGDMLVGISKGDYTLGYNMMGAYAISRGAKDLPNLAVVFPSDYTLMLTRVVFVGKRAQHPNAARLWLDYMLSARGQAVLGNQIDLYPIRIDVKSKFTAQALLEKIGRAAAPIRLDPALATNLERQRQAAFKDAWTGRIATAKQNCP